MSGEIDNRIVSLSFENAQFDKRVNQSIDSLSKLEKSMNLEQGARSMSALSQMSRTFSLSNLAHNVENVSNRFSTMGIIGVTALQNITNSAINTGKNLLKSLTIQPISSGWMKYEQETAAVQTIMAATGLEIDKVSTSLEKLSWFTDETSYNFVDMVGNIGKFTSAGVDLEVSVTAMQGIANWAAISGQNAQTASRAMYNLSQALGTGSVQVRDWMSIENANMATIEFKNTVIETAKELGVLNQKTGKTKKGLLVTAENFRETLKDKWFTSDVLTASLDKYGEYATKVFELATEQGITASEAMALLGDETESLGSRAFKAAQEAKTFTDVLDSVKDAVSSGWMGTWRNVFGNYEEAKGMWTRLANELYDIFAEGGNARNEMLAAWAEAGGRDDLFEGLFDALQGLKNIGLAISDVFRKIFPEVTVDNLLNMSAGIKEFGRQLKLATIYVERNTGEWTDLEEIITRVNRLPFGKELKRGSKDSKDEIKQMQQQLIDAGYDLGKFGADGIFGPETEKALKSFQKEVGLIENGLYDLQTHEKLQDFLKLDDTTEKKVTRIAEKYNKFGLDMRKFQSIIGGVFAALNIFGKAFKFLGRVAGLVWKALKPVRDMFITLAASLGDNLIGFNKWIDSADIFESWANTIEKALAPVTQWLDIASDKILYFLGVGEDRFSAEGTNIQRFGDYWIAFKEKVKPVTDWLQNAGTKFKQFLGLTGGLDENGQEILTLGKWWNSLKEQIKETGAFDRVSDAIDRMRSAWRELWPTIKATYDKIKEYLGTKFGRVFENFSGEKSVLATAIDGISSFIAALVDWFTTLFDSLSGNEQFEKTLVNIGKNITDFGEKIWTFITMVGNAIKGFFSNKTDGSTDLGTNIKERLQSFSEIGDFLKDFFEPVIDYIGFLFGKARGLLGEVNVGGLVGIIGAILGIVGLIKFVKFVSGTIKSVSGLMESITAFKQGYPPKAESMATKVLKFAVAIALVASAIYVLGNMNRGALIQGGLAITVIMGLLLLFAHFTKKIGNKVEIVGVMGLAGAIAILAGIAFLLSKMDWKTFLNGMAKIAIIMGLLMLFMLSLKGVKGNVQIKGLIGLALAIGLLAFIADRLARMDLKHFLKGMLMMGAIILTLKFFTKGVSKVGGGKLELKGLLSIALAIGILAGIVALMGKMRGDQMLKGLIGLVAVMLVLRFFVKSISKLNGQTFKMGGLIALTVALSIMAGIVTLLGSLPTKDLAKGVIALTVSMLAMSLMLKAVSKVTRFKGSGVNALLSLIGLVLVMGAFALALKEIKDVDTDVIKNFTSGLSILLLSFGVYMKLAGSLSFAGVGSALFGIIGVIAIVAGIMGLMHVPAIREFVNGGARFLGEAIGNFMGSMKAAELSAFTSGLKAFDNIDVNEDGIKQAIAAAQLIADFSAGLPAKTVVEKIVDFFVGSELSQFSSGMIDFGEAIKSFSKSLAGTTVTEELISETAAAIKIAKQIQAFEEGLEPLTGLDVIQTWLNQKSKLGQFSTDMVGFGASFNAFAIEMGKINGSELGSIESKTTTAVEIATSLSNFSKGLEGLELSDVMFTWFSGGKTKFSAFSEDMMGFGTAFNAFISEISQIPDDLTDVETKTTNAIKIATLVHAFSTGVSTLGGFEAFTAGLFGSQFSGFSQDIVAFATSFNSFSDEMMKVGINPALPLKTTFAISIAKQMDRFRAGMQSEVSGGENFISWITGKTSFSTFTRDMFKFAAYFNDFAEEMGLVTIAPALPLKTTFALSIAGQMDAFKAGMATPISGGENFISWITGETSFSKFTRDMFKFAEYFNSFSDEMNRINVDLTLPFKTQLALLSAKAISDFITGIAELSLTDQGYGELLFGTRGATAETLFGQMIQLGQAMSDLSTHLAKVDSTNFGPTFDTILASITKMAEFIQKVSSPDFTVERSKMNWKSTFEEILTDFQSLGYTIADTSRYIADVDIAPLTSMLNAIGNFGTMLTKLPGTDVDTAITIFKDSLDKIQKVFEGDISIPVDPAAFLSGLDPDAIAVKIKDAATVIATATSDAATTLSSDTSELNTAGASISDALAAGASSGTSSMNTVGYDMMSALSSGLSQNKGPISEVRSLINSLVGKVRENISKFNTAGFDMSSGMASGIARGAYLAVNAAIKMAKDAIDAAKKALESHSPSKVFRGIGYSAPQGLALGMADGFQIVKTAGTTLGEAAISSAKGALTNFSDLFSFNLDADPVIRPVVDLSAVQKGAKDAQSLLHSSANLGMAGSVSKQMAGTVGSVQSRTSRVQNGSWKQEVPRSFVDGGVNVTGNTFVIRDDNDIELLAQELGQFTRHGQRALGASVNR